MIRCSRICAGLLPLILILALVLTACGGNGGPPDETPTIPPPSPTSAPPTATPEPAPTPTPTPAPEPDVNLIAFVGLDDSIYTIRPDGTDQQLVSIPMSGETASLAGGAFFASHTVYNWPTWSPDASKLAFTSFSDNGDFGGALWLVDIPGGLPDKVFQDPDDTIGRFVAQRSPHYIYWSPGSDRVAFLAPTPTSLVLYMIETHDPHHPEVLSFGAPSYMTWSPDGQYLLHHLVDAVDLVDTRNDFERVSLDARSTSFRTPAWSPDSRLMAFVDGSIGADTLVITDVQGDSKIEIDRVSILTVFLWSPSANEIAYTELTPARSLGIPTYGGLAIFDVDSGETRQITNREIAAFFWSPDGSMVAYVGIDRPTATISWYVNDRSGKSEKKLTDFVPSSEQLFVMFAFFDQYAYSNNLWSPDGRSLVYSARDPDANGTGGTTIQVISIDGSSPPRVIAPGHLAFWSPK